MKPNPLRTLESPPPDLAARVLEEINATRQSLSVRWLVGAETAVLVACLWISASSVSGQLSATASAVRDWTGTMVEATKELSNRVETVLPSVEAPEELWETLSRYI